MDKKTIRYIMKTKRKNIINKDFYDEKIFNNLMDFIKDFNNIASFSSLKDEIDTSNINKFILENKKLYLPKVQKDEMFFINVKSLDNLVRSSFNILEPMSDDFSSINDIDCIIVPLLAYDKDKFRVGYGKGYYDKALKDYKGVTIGVAYSFQYVDSIDIDKNDIGLDFICNEINVF